LTRFWRECRSPKILRIFGLRFTPVNTTHTLENRLVSGFRLQGVFPPHLSPEKQNDAFGVDNEKAGFLTV